MINPLVIYTELLTGSQKSHLGDTEITVTIFFYFDPLLVAELG